jgi:hypothetical protein
MRLDLMTILASPLKENPAKHPITIKPMRIST